MSAGDHSLLGAIPTYNERENIVGLLTSLLARYPTAHVVVIDDDAPPVGPARW
jgi:glycosyl transferase family 2